MISASASTLSMLEVAGLAGLVEVCMDAEVIHGENIRTAPSPELLLAACRRLDVQPQNAVTFTHSASGVVAGLAAGVTVIGVGQDSDAELLRDYGARRIIPSLSALLHSSLLADAAIQ